MNATSAALPSPAPAMKGGSFATKIDPRWYSSSLLTTILVIGQWRFQILGDSYLPWFVALASAILTEIVLWKYFRGGWPNLLSAYISGNSVAFLLKPDGSLLWPFVIGSFVSIASKYVLNWRGRHLWNPTNFGVCALLLVASEKVSMLGHQWGNDLVFVAIIWTVGLLTVTRAKVRHITLAWFGAFVAFAFLRSLVNGHPFLTELAPVTGPMYTLYMFFMVTDPKVQMSGKRNQILVAVGVAAAECVIRLLCDFEVIGASNPLRFAPPMFALFVVGPAALAWQMARTPALQKS